MIGLLQIIGLFIFFVQLQGRLLGIPTTPFETSGGSFSLNGVKNIIVEEKYVNSVDEKGQTLIPPTLGAFAKTFADDLKTSKYSVDVKLFLVNKESSEPSITLSLGNPKDYLDAAGRETSEGYSISVSSSGIVIIGASPLGVWWGTRTLLQQAALSNGSIPYGTGKDSPGWGTRGMMLDAGRHYYPPEFLVELCSYMSFFKQNTFHLHLSDNLYNNVTIYTRKRSLELYARFRLWSESPELEGLAKYKNESYTKEQFDFIQSSCVARGVTVIPEIEAPGHALPIVQWKPELGLTNDLSLLNISHPGTIPAMQLIWKTFLPWFQTKTVHIGADEYTGKVNDYNIFVNAMASYIGSVSGKSIRIWGTFPPKDSVGYTNIYTNVSIQHWEFFEDNPLNDYILKNYSVLNSDDTFYVVAKYSGSYPPTLPYSKTFNSDPSSGGLWYPNIFNTQRAVDNPKRPNPFVLGAVAPLWNDYGPNATVYREAYYAWQEGIPALADKQWGGDITRSEFLPTLTKLRSQIPAQNLDRSIPSKSQTILKYIFESQNNGTIPDLSGNSYHGSTDCKMNVVTGALIIDSCSLMTPLLSKGRNYTLTLTLTIKSLDPENNITLISGADSTLMLTPTITFFSGGNYYRTETKLAKDARYQLIIYGSQTNTTTQIMALGLASAQDEFITTMGINGARFEKGSMVLEAPLREIGGIGCGWKGEVHALELLDYSRAGLLGRKSLDS